MSVMRTRVKMLRWPRVFRNPLRRFFLNTRSFGPRASPSTTPSHLGIGDKRRPRDDVAGVLLDQEHLVEREFRAGFTGSAVDLDDRAGRHLELAATGLNNRVHERYLT